MKTYIYKYTNSTSRIFACRKFILISVILLFVGSFCLIFVFLLLFCFHSIIILLLACNFNVLLS